MVELYKGQIGSKCGKNKDCISGFCSQKTSLCTKPGPLDPCRVLPKHDPTKMKYSIRKANKCADEHDCHVDSLRCVPYAPGTNPQLVALVSGGHDMTHCVTSVECDAGWFCNNIGQQDAGMCVKMRNVGETCSIKAPCVDNAVCISGKCVGRCVDESDCHNMKHPDAGSWKCFPGGAFGASLCSKEEIIKPTVSPPKPATVPSSTPAVPPATNVDMSWKARFDRSMSSVQQSIKEHPFIWGGSGIAVVLLLFLVMALVVKRSKRSKDRKKSVDMPLQQNLPPPPYMPPAPHSYSPQEGSEKFEKSPSIMASVPTSPN